MIETFGTSVMRSTVYLIVAMGDLNTNTVGSTMGSHLYVLGMCVLHHRLVNIWMQLDLKVLVVSVLFPL